MSRKVTFAIICIILLWHVSVFFHGAAAQSVERLDQTQSFWVQLWNTLKEHPFAFSMVLVSFLTIFGTVMATLKKDKLLKSLAGQLITIEHKDGNRNRGRLRVESEGLEVVAEKANKGHEKVSYLLRKDEFKNIHALVRYHDFLTDREKEQRQAEVNKVYHPSIGMRLGRRFRNVINEMKRVATEAFTIMFSKVSQQFTVGGRKYGTEVEEKGKEAVTYMTEATYDALIDKLIGTKVVVRVAGKTQEYVGVLKDYTGKFIELLDVHYGNGWQILMKQADGSKHERGLILRKDGNNIVIQSKSPFKVTLKHIYWQEGRANAERKNINKTIEPFSELRFNFMPPTLEIGVSPFEKLRLPTRYHYKEYKKIILHFASNRVADVVMLKDYGIVRHRTEKYEPKLLDLGALSDALLTSKGEELALEGNPSGATLSIHNGYLTNLPKERMDIGEVETQLNQRWAAESSFAVLDKKLRPISSHYFLNLLPLIKIRKVLALLALMITIHADEKRERKRFLPLIYFAICASNRRKRRRSYRPEVLIKKKRRSPRFLLANFSKLRLRRRVAPAE